jgi:hypothetical protein
LLEPRNSRLAWMRICLKQTNNNSKKHARHQ